jgi:hypothetical protein
MPVPILAFPVSGAHGARDCLAAVWLNDGKYDEFGQNLAAVVQAGVRVG